MIDFGGGGLGEKRGFGVVWTNEGEMWWVPRH
jgi:hypothetical protein